MCVRRSTVAESLAKLCGIILKMEIILLYFRVQIKDATSLGLQHGPYTVYCNVL